MTVALSGQGADELFGGYRKHRVASLAEPGPRCPAPLRARGRRGAAARPGRARPARRRARRRRDPVPRLLASSGLVHADLRGELFGGALAEHAGAAEARRCAGRLAGAPGAAPLEAALYLDARLGLVDDMLTYFDRASMACSLEVRVPFLDHELVELCARIPTVSTRCAGCRASTCCAWRRASTCPDFVLDKRKRGFFNESVADVDRRRRRRRRGRSCCSLRDPAYAAA